MILGIAEDFTSNVTLDSELTNIPSSGLFLNSGVHPSITIENLLSFLPILDIEIEDWSNIKQYNIYSKTRNKKDIVIYDGIIYQSISNNANKIPDPITVNPTDWIKTNEESLRIKSFVYKVQDRFLSDMQLTKRLIDNQYLYEDAPIDRPMTSLPVDYVGWTFEAKGSDYVNITINQISIQKDGSAPIDIYVIHNNELVDTMQITPSNGAVDFKAFNFSFSGVGQWRFVFDSTDVYTSNGWIDSLKYDGFVCYGCSGIGADPETAKYSINNRPSGLGFNVSVNLDSSVYIENNLLNFGACLRATFEYMAFQMMYSNSNSRLNMQERNARMGVNLEVEIKVLDADTSVKRYYDEKKRAMKILSKTFDTQLDANELEISISSV